MDYEILYKDAFPVVKCHLNKGEQIKAESDAMIAMSSTMEVSGGTEGGIMKGLGRMLAGESFFFQYLKASRGDGEVIFGHAYPGSIVAIELDGTYGLRVQKDGFLASTQGIQVSTKAQNITKGLFSGEGLFILEVSGKGTVFLSSYGSVHEIELEAGEEYIVDNGHLVAWPQNMQYKIEQASKSLGHSIMSGECLVCRFRGPGKVLIQTRNPKGFRNWLTKLGLGRS